MRKIDDFGGFSPGLASYACQSIRRRREHTRVSRRVAAVARDAKRAIFRILEFCNSLVRLIKLDFVHFLACPAYLRPNIRTQIARGLQAKHVQSRVKEIF